MEKTGIRLALDSDRNRLLEAITDQQDYERALHETRRPGAEIAQGYLAYLKDNVAQNRGTLLVAEVAGAFAGYAACWIEHHDNVAETDDSNHFGYVADTYVVPEFRGRGIVGRLLAGTQKHVRDLGISRIRIGVLANNASALRAYEKSGFEPYEVVMEKRLRR
jgi:ribosomal protein S18 acetylase RimI-like enzyme